MFWTTAAVVFQLFPTETSGLQRGWPKKTGPGEFRDRFFRRKGRLAVSGSLIQGFRGAVMGGGLGRLDVLGLGSARAQEHSGDGE